MSSVLLRNWQARAVPNNRVWLCCCTHHLLPLLHVCQICCSCSKGVQMCPSTVVHRQELLLMVTGWGHENACRTVNKSCLAMTAKQETACDHCLACVRANTAIQLLQEEMGSPLPQGAGVSGVDAWCPPGEGAKAAGPLLAVPHMTSVLAPLALGNLLPISCPKTVMLALSAAHQNDMLALSYIQGG